MKKGFIIFLASLLLFCSSCQNTSVQNNQPSASTPVQTQLQPESWTKNTDPITLTLVSEITRSMNGEARPLPKLWGEDEVSRHIMNVTGVRLKQLADGNEEADIHVILASQELPDLYCGSSVYPSRVTVNYPLENSDWCYSLDELAEQYCPDFFANVDKLEILNNTAEDGHVYTLRSGYNDLSVYDDERIPIYPTYAMTVNTDILHALNADIPDTVEELEALLYAASELEIGKEILAYRMIDATTSPLADWMGVQRDVYWDEAASSVRTPLRQETWVEYLQMVNRWYRDGVLHMVDIPAAYWDSKYGDLNDPNTSTYMYYKAGYDALMLSNRKGFVTGTLTDLAIRTTKIRDGAAEHEGGFPYQVITHNLAYRGEIQDTAEDNTAYTTEGWGEVYYSGTGLFIMKYCQNPDRAIHFYQFLRSDEGAKLTHWGLEGKHYDIHEDGLPMFKGELRKPSEGVSAASDVVGDLGDYPYVEIGVNYWKFAENPHISGLLHVAPDSFTDNWDGQQLRKQLTELGVNYKKLARENKMPVLQFALPQENSDDYIRYNAIRLHWDKAIQSIVTEATDSNDVVTRWNILMHELKQMNLDELEAAMNTRFAKALKRYQAAGYYTHITPKQDNR